MVRRIFIAALVCLLFSLPVYGGGKTLILYGPSGFYEASFSRVCAVGGLQHTFVDSADSVAVWALATSGEYGIALCMGLPDLETVDTGAELDAAGWPRLDNYTNRDDALAFPIPLILLMDGGISGSGVWSAVNTGQLGTNTTTFTGDDYNLTDASGGVLYTRTHAQQFNMPRIATHDTLSYMYPIVWHEIAGPTTNQVYCTLWLVKGSGNHVVVYVHTASYSYQQGFVMALIRAFARFQEVEVCFGVHGFGAKLNAYSLHQFTDHLAGNLEDIKDFVLASGMKLELNTETYRWANADVDSMRLKYPEVEQWCADYPDNFRMTLNGYYRWNSGDEWLFSYVPTRTQGQIETSIAAMMDSVADHGFLSTIINTTFISPHTTWRWNYRYNCSDAFRACVKYGISNIHTMGGVDDNISRADTRRANHLPKSVRVRYDDRASSTAAYYDTEFHAWAITTINSNNPSNILGGEVSGVKYTDTPSDTLAVLSAIWFKRICGYYVAGYDAATNNDAQKYGYYRPGIMVQPNYMAGDNNVLLFMNHINNYKNMCNHIVSAYGTTGSTGLIKYSWIEDVVHDRTLGRKWHSSHVTRNSTGTGIWWR